jgi:signal transduction histidine kinase
VLGAAAAQAVAVVALGLVPALVVGSRRAVVAAQASELRALAREQDALLATALATQRTEMARELHDIAAHHLAAMVVQASVAERLVDRDPDAARRNIVELRTQGRATLHDLRLVVGALRERGEDAGGLEDGGGPVPGLAALAQLVAGTAAELCVVGAPHELPPVADVSVYRVAQEALSNARDHAPGAPVIVRVEHQEGATVLEVRNGPSATAPDPRPGGLGLVGMRERAELIGADLDVGPCRDGGWRVRLEIPLSAS